MARYINADQMIADTEATKQVCEAIELDGIINYIEEHIAADVQEVRHAEWIKLGVYHFDERGVYRFECSHCGVTESFETPYCPWCGAKMDGKDEENGNH